MVAEDAGGLSGGDHLTVDGQNIGWIDLHGRGLQHLAIQRHAALGDQPLHIAARAHTGPCKRFGRAFAAAVWRAGLTREPRVGSVRIVDHDHRTMRIALEAAQAAEAAGETPVGAVVVDPATGEVVAVGANQPIGTHDPTAHAEIVALRAAAQKLGNYRLTGLTLVVTLEPCAMCAGAISHARIGRLVYGAQDAKGGAVVHGSRVFDQPICHWRPEVVGGLMADESSAMLKAFFKARR